MGYNLKTTCSYLAELEEEEIGTISTIFQPSSLAEQNIKGESIVDLKLGSLSDFRQDLVKRFEDNQVAFMEPFSSTTGSSKRTRTPSGGNQVVSCLVDGCRSDLSKCRDYHRRHKVCEMHSKTPRVTIRGHEQRFCQQCSRFHSLVEFDEGKRSCRKRLEGHNRRRRKPQPEPLPVSHGNFFSASQGSRILAFGNQPIVGANSVVSTTWPAPIKTDSNPALYRHSSSLSGSYSQPYQVRQFPFLQGPESPLAGQTFHQDLNSASGCGGCGGGSSSSSHNENGHKMFCNQVINSDRALSLLSSSPAETPDMGIGLGRVTDIDPIPATVNPARSSINGLHWQYTVSHGQGLEEQPESLGLFSNIRSNNSLGHDVFQDEPNANETVGHQTLSFSWE